MIDLIERTDDVTGAIYTDIYITKGDTLILKVSPMNADDTPYVVSEGDSIRFALKKNYSDEECLVLKVIPNETLTLRVDSQDMKTLQVDRKGYVYDFQLTDADGIVNTFMSGRLYTLDEVE